MMYTRTPYTFDRVIRIVFTVIGILGALYLLDILKAVLLPFMVACLLAYILEPVVKFNMRIFHLRKRFLPVVLTLIEALGLLTLFCVIFIPYLVQECREMADTITKYATTQIQIPYVSEQIHHFIRSNINLDEVTRWMTREEWVKLAKQTLTSSWNVVSTSVAFIFGVASWVIVFLYLIFIMLDYERLMLSFRQLVPYQHRHRVFHIFDDVKNAMNRYFRGQFVIAMSVGVLFAIGFLIIERPMAVVLGLFIGVRNMAPYLQ
ncbi:MAG: AI-2E family transporter, partial [Muribaculaceae bacterium]|nr:AI-2E family transporter [Muribaculaceae bacterium]